MVFIALFTFMNVSYASFPVDEECYLSYRVEYFDVPVYSDTLKNNPLMYGVLAGSTIDESPIWKYLWILPVVLLLLLFLGMSAMKMN